MFYPLLESTARSTEAITKELIPMREEMKNLNENLLQQAAAAHPPIAPRKPKLAAALDANLFEQYNTNYDKTKIDKYFSIERTGDNQYRIDDKKGILDKNSNIFVDGIKYEGTPGLWALIMMKTPPPKSYTRGDLLNYSSNQCNDLSSNRN